MSSRVDADKVTALESLAQVFEHSITWEDDLWRADPVDVEAVHRQARQKFGHCLHGCRHNRPAVGI